jgi:hypothetical protein
MPRRSTPSPGLQELRQLAGDPAARAARAVQVLARVKDIQGVRAALEVLKDHHLPAARPALRACFEHYAEEGGRRDTGAYLRAAILQALRPMAEGSDLPLLERAASTYEFLPPARSEEASLLRSTALVVMQAVDERLARFHAVRLLADPYTSRLSGEPALTAVRVLVAGGHLEPLYYYALHQPAPDSDVLSECLKNLAGLPPSLLPGLIDKYARSADEVVLVGLLDLALEAGQSAFVHQFLSSTTLYAVYRYVIAELVASHAEQWLAELAQQAQHERHARKLGILEEALSLGRADEMIKTALAAVRRSQKLATRETNKHETSDQETH